MALSSMPWQVIAAVIALVSLLVFLPLAWVRASLPARGASLLLTLLTPLFLAGGLIVFLPLYYAIYLDHYHLQNELGAFLGTLVPAVTALGAWILGIVDVLRQRAWGWLAPVALLPFLGTLTYGFAGRRKNSDGQPYATSLGSLLLASAVLALLGVLLTVVPMIAGLTPRNDSTPDLFALFGAILALVAGVAGGIALLPDQPLRATAQLAVTAALALHLVAGISFPVQIPWAPSWPPSVILRVFGIPGTEAAGLWVTLGLTATVAAAVLASTQRVAERLRR